MVDLDDRAIYSKIDRSDMRAQIRGLPEQCRQAWKEALSLHLPPDYASVTKVIVLGVGGSAIGGDLLKALTSGLKRPLVAVNRDYDLPSWADSDTLVIAASYSGNTEETLSAFSQALESRCKKVVISTGGLISSLAAEHKVPVFTIEHAAAPRAALGYGLLPLLAIMQGLGFLESKAADVENMVGLLEKRSAQWREDAPTGDNQAKQLALQLSGRVPVIYGAGILTDVARRWKTQINENSKCWAFFETLSELNHNAVVGYRYPKAVKDGLFVVFLRCPSIHPRTMVRYEITGELLQQNGIPYEFVDSEGASPLAQIMGAVLLGDWVSYYLAMLNEVDPTPVPEIDFLKKRLSGTK